MSGRIILSILISIYSLAVGDGFLKSEMSIMGGRVYPSLEYHFLFDNGELSEIEVLSKFERTFAAQEIKPLLYFEPYDWLQLRIGAKVRQVFGGDTYCWFRGGAVLNGGGHRFEVGMIRRSISRLTAYDRPAFYDMPSAEYRYNSEFFNIWLIGTRFTIPSTTTYEDFLWAGKLEVKKGIIGADGGVVIYHRGGFDGYPEITPKLPPASENYGLFFGGNLTCKMCGAGGEVVMSWENGGPKRWAVAIDGGIKIFGGFEISPYACFLQQGYYFPRADDFVYLNSILRPEDSGRWGSYFEIGVSYTKELDYFNIGCRVEQGVRYKGVVKDFAYSRNRVLFNIGISL